MEENLSKNEEKRDKQQAKGFGFCQLCGCIIYVGDLYYAPEGARICVDCLPEFSRKYFRPDLRVAGSFLSVR